MSRVLVLLLNDEDVAWELLHLASEDEAVTQAVMVNPDHPHSVASLFGEDQR